MMGTDGPHSPIRPMAFPLSKTEKQVSNSHCCPTLVLPTVRGGLLQAAVKDF